MGADDPRLASNNKLDFRLSRMIGGWKREDPPPKRVKPIPVQVIRRIMFTALQTGDELVQATADMTALGFFFLCRPGEYTDEAGEDACPFKIEDVQLFVGQVRIDLDTATDEQIKCATFVTFTFTWQKNGVRGEVIGLGLSGDPYLCPVKSAVRRVLYARRHSFSKGTPLARVRGPARVTSKRITDTLRTAVSYLGPSLGFLPEDVSTRSLRAGGANALLLARVDPDIISLIGRWRSDEMLRYLHVQAAPLMADYSKRMIAAGTYNLIPGQEVPTYEVPMY